MSRQDYKCTKFLRENAFEGKWTEWIEEREPHPSDPCEGEGRKERWVGGILECRAVLSSSARPMGNPQDKVTSEEWACNEPAFVSLLNLNICWEQVVGSLTLDLMPWCNQGTWGCPWAPWRQDCFYSFEGICNKIYVEVLSVSRLLGGGRWCFSE